MKLYNKLSRFPLGAINAEGFLREQLIRSKNGMGGHLFELEPGMINDPFINKSYVPAWGNGDQSGWGAEISGNYWTGYIQLAYTLHDEEMIEKATWWVNTMLTHQKEDGYLGTYYEEDAKIYEDYNAWGTSCALRGLIAFYEASGRKDVLEAVHRCLLWFCDKWKGDKKTSYAGVYIIEPLVFCYYYTGDHRLIDFAEEYNEYMVNHDIFNKSYAAMERDLQYTSDHTAGAGCSVRLPALLYSADGNERFIKASERMISQIREKCVQVSGSPVSFSEYFGPVGSTSETEYCSYAFYNQTYSYMSYITGKSCYGDYMEEMFYNGAQGARKKDEKAISYLNSPNQIYATDSSTTAGNCNNMQMYAPCYPVSCCPVNSVAVLPEFIRGMFLNDSSDGIYCCAYGPCSLSYEGIDISENTLYPFRNSISFDIKTEKAFTLYLKIPYWSKGEEINLNGNKATVSEYSDGYAPVRIEKGSSRVDVKFKAEIEVIKVDDSDYAGKHPIAFKYGALEYVYHIPEIWCPVHGSPMTPLPDGWSWYNVYPEFKEADTPDPHDMIGLRRKQISWNIAVDENLSKDDFIIEECNTSGYVWENPPIVLHTHCYKAPYLCAMYPTKVFEPFGEKQYVTDKIELTLVPYGCTNLRISYFARADIK